MTPLLILVHVEEMFRKFFPPMYIQRVAKAVRTYDNIHFTSEIDNDGVPIEQIQPLLNKEISWAWGHEPCTFEGTPEEEWVIPSPSPHEWTWVCPELRELKGIQRPVLLGGGCDGECLLNMETCLKYLGIQYRKVDGLVYGA